MTDLKFYFLLFGTLCAFISAMYRAKDQNNIYNVNCYRFFLVIAIILMIIAIN